jgi:hypothetical protein
MNERIVHYKSHLLLKYTQKIEKQPGKMNYECREVVPSTSRNVNICWHYFLKEELQQMPVLKNNQLKNE